MSDFDPKAAVAYNKKRPYTDATWRLIQATVGTTVDGDPGPKTARAVAEWQEDHGLEVDGAVGPTTLAAIRGAKKARGEKFSPHVSDDALHPMPETRWYSRRSGYEHAIKFPYVDRHWLALTAILTWVAGMMRLLTQTRGDRCNRSPWSITSLDLLSLGIAHWWAYSVIELIARICRELPGLAAWAWGEARARAMVDPNAVLWIFVEAVAEADAGKRRGRLAREALKERDKDKAHKALRSRRGRWPRQLEWFVVGWWALAGHQAVVRIQVETWLETYVRRGLRYARALGIEDHLTGPDGNRIMAALCRAGNSGKRPRGISKRSPLRDLERWYRRDRSAGGYGKPRRWQQIESDPRFDGPWTGASPDDLDWTAEVVRPDGTVPDWPDA